MLRKLLKYEIKATARIFLPLYLVLIVFAFINYMVSLMSAEGWSTPAFISLSLYVIILVGMCVITYVVMIQRFYKNLLKDEGYLMLTLPTRPWMHITSKLLISMMWSAISAIAALISILIISMKEVTLNEIIDGISTLWAEAYEMLGSSAGLYAVEMVIGMIVSMASGILLIYASMALGHLSNNHKVLASIGAFLAINTVTQIMSSMIFSAVLSIVYFDNKSFALPESNIHLFIWIVIGMSAIFSTAYFIITNTVMSKKLNLE